MTADMVSGEHKKRNDRLKAWQPKKLSRSKRRNPSKRRRKKLYMQALILIGERMADSIWEELNRPSRLMRAMPTVPVGETTDG